MQAEEDLGGSPKEEEIAVHAATELKTGPSSVGALIIRIGFWGFLDIIIVQYIPKPYSNY